MPLSGSVLLLTQVDGSQWNQVVMWYTCSKTQTQCKERYWAMGSIFLGYYFLLIKFIYFTFQLKFPLPLLLLFPLPTSSQLLPIHSSSVSVQKGAGLPWVSTKHGISSWCRTKLLPLYWGWLRQPSVRNGFSKTCQAAGTGIPAARSPTGRQSQPTI